MSIAINCTLERFQKLDNKNIKWTVTFDDPKFFIEQWSVTLPITRQNTEIMSYSCEENEKDRVHILHRAKESQMVSKPR